MSFIGFWSKKDEEIVTRNENGLLSLSDSVVSALRNAGYDVTYFEAIGMGDMPTHRIKWSKQPSSP